MSEEENNEIILRHYLLGDVTAEDRQQIEQRMLTDGTFFEQLCILEEELVDEYVCEQLIPEEQEKFRNGFLSTTEGVEQVKLATNLRALALATLPAPSAPAARSLSEPASQPRPLVYGRSNISINRRTIWAVTVIGLLVIAALAIRLGRLQSQLNQLRQQPLATAHEQELQEQLAAERTRNAEMAEEFKRGEARRAELEQQLAALSHPEKGEPGHSSLASLMLVPGRLRGAEASRHLVIEPGTPRVQLQLILTRNVYAVYRVSLKSADGRELWNQSSLLPHARRGRKMVEANLPAGILFTGDFSVALQGSIADDNFEEVGNYYFSVTKK